MMYGMRSLQHSLHIHLLELLDIIQDLVQISQEPVRLLLSHLQSRKLCYIFCVLGFECHKQPLFIGGFLGSFSLGDDLVGDLLGDLFVMRELPGVGSTPLG